MSRFNRCLDCKVYVGNLAQGASRHELEDSFSEYGELTNVWVARNPPGFAFVEFKSRHDARDAAEGMDNRFICGRRIVAEMSSGESRRSRGGGGGGGRYPPRRPMSDEKCYECGERGHFARECSYNRRRRRSRTRSRSRSYSPRRRRSRSFNRSYGHRDRSRDRSHDRSRDRSRDRSHSRSRSRSHSHYSPVRRTPSADRD